MIKIPAWRGFLRQYPLNPDGVMARHLNWTPGRRQIYSLCQYPEPDNLTAAAAWTRINQKDIPEDAIVYKDPKTNLWVITVDDRAVPKDTVDDWCSQAIRNGAVAVWINDKCKNRRPPSPRDPDNPDEPYERRGRAKGCINLKMTKPLVTPLGPFIGKRAACVFLGMSIVKLNRLLKTNAHEYYHVSLDEYEKLSGIAR